MTQKSKDVRAKRDGYAEALKGMTQAQRKQFIDDKAGKDGLHSRSMLRRLGVAWPPPKGWKAKLAKDGTMKA